MNDGSNTMVPHPLRNKSSVDLTLSTPSVAPYLTWNVLDDPMGSDHFPILIVRATVAIYH